MASRLGAILVVVMLGIAYRTLLGEETMTLNSYLNNALKHAPDDG